MIFALLTLPGCALFAGEDTFTTDFAQVSCERMQDCYKANFEAEYDDVAECVDEAEALAEDNEDLYDDCDFDDDKAASCLAEMRANSCGDLLEDGVEDCAEVWDCDGDTRLDTGREADADTDTDSDTDSDADGDTDRDPVFTDIWSNNGVNLSISRGSGTYSFGMAETSNNGWEGEDCLAGPGPSGASGSYDVCHDDVNSTGISLETINVLSDLEANYTTLFTDTIAESGNLALVAASNSSGDCWTWGDRYEFYDALGCEDL